MYKLDPKITQELLLMYRSTVHEIASLMTDHAKLIEKHGRYRSKVGPLTVSKEVWRQQMDAESDLRSRARHLEAMRSYIKPAIDLLPQGVYQTILVQRYFCGKSWQQIATMVALERTQVWRYHRAAIEMLEWPDGSESTLQAFLRYKDGPQEAAQGHQEAAQGHQD